MFKKHMTPLTRGGQTTAHQGKGSAQAPMPHRRQIGQLATAPGGASMNNYAKATPMAQPSDSDTDDAGPPGLGGMPGIGM